MEDDEPPDRKNHTDRQMVGQRAIELDLDAVYGALAAVDRRRILSYLLDRKAASVEEIVDVLVGWRTGEEGVVGPDERARIEIRLHHVHLPELRTAELVEYDADGEIRLAPLSEAAEAMIRTAGPDDRTRVDDRQP